MVNDKQKMARLITEERRVLMGSLYAVRDINRLFNLHKCDWMAQDPGTYSEEIVREFYAFYVATLRGSISKRSKPLAQDPLTSTLVRGSPVDISLATIRRSFCGPATGQSWSLNTVKFDYRWDIVPSGAFQRNGALDIVLIRDETNVAAPRRDPQVEVHPLGVDLTDTVGQAQVDDLSIPVPTDTILGSSSQAASMAPSSSRSKPQLGATVVPSARVQKLKAQMATLLHHI
ncbi:hypothetical protein H5410_003301 [Solanum commersonii]|uniref:Integrase core domain containing protein n=1 Tax=Solanum commersonii TaxID=4109 RepID=A0A9J6B4M9_SOLCO|nr:hypothetical protein H5410_003301 [Solanum commersonii]